MKYNSQRPDTGHGVLRMRIPLYTVGLLILSAVCYGAGAPKSLAMLMLLLAWVVIHVELDVEWVVGFSLGAGLCVLLIFGTATVPHAVLQYALVIAILGWLIALLRTIGTRKGGGPDAATVAIFTLITVMALADGITITDSTIYKYLIRYVATIVIVFVLARRATARELYAYTTTMILFTVSQLSVAVLEMNGARLAPFPSYDQTSLTQGNNITGGTHRAEAMMSHPIPFSLLLVFTCCLAWTRFGPKRTVLKVAFTAACVWGVVESGSRSAIAATGAVVVISILGPRVPRPARIASGIAALCLLAVYLYSTSVQRYVETGLAKLGGSGSFNHRSNAISAIPKILSLRDGRQYLFGTGIGSEHTQPYSSILHLAIFSSVDNEFTSTLVWGGVVALVALIAAIAIAMWRGGAICRTILIVMLVYMFSFDIFLWSGEALMLIIGLGFATNYALARGEIPADTLMVSEEPMRARAHSGARDPSAPA